MYNYFVWLYQITTKSPAVKRMHPTLGSWFGNPSFRYLWSQNLCQGKAEQLNPVTHSDRYLLLSCTNRWEKLTALYGSVTQRKVTSSANQVNKEQYHSDRFIFTARRCTSFVTLGEKGEGSFYVPGKQGKLKFHFSTAGGRNLKKKKGGGGQKEEKETPQLQDSTEPHVEPKWDWNDSTLTPGHWRSCLAWMGRCSSHHGIHRAVKLNRERWQSFNCNSFFMNN